MSLNGYLKRENLHPVPNHYEPSQWRGKRLVYRSTDPDEPNRELIKFLKFLIGGVTFLAIIWICVRMGWVKSTQA